MNLNRTHLVVGLLSALGTAFIGFMMFGATYGELKGNVRSLEFRVQKLEEATGKVVRPKVLKGDLCLQLFTQFNGASGNSARMKELDAQLSKLNCYEGVSENAVARIDPTNGSER